MARKPNNLGLDAIDIRILSALQREGRITKLKLAERVGLSPTPCWERLRRLEAAGIIEGYHAQLALKKLTGFTAVLAEITLEQHTQAAFERFERAVMGVPEIVACWSTGGGVDYIVKFVTRDVDAYQTLIDRLLTAEIGIDRYVTYIVTKPVKESHELPLAHLLEKDRNS